MRSLNNQTPRGKGWYFSTLSGRWCVCLCMVIIITELCIKLSIKGITGFKNLLQTTLEQMITVRPGFSRSVVAVLIASSSPWVQVMARCLTAMMWQSMLSNHQRSSVAFTWQQFYRRCTRYQFIKCIWKLYLRLHLPENTELETHVYTQVPMRSPWKSWKW